jgi:hypothetical protein
MFIALESFLTAHAPSGAELSRIVERIWRCSQRWALINVQLQTSCSVGAHLAAPEGTIHFLYNATLKDK